MRHRLPATLLGLACCALPPASAPAAAQTTAATATTANAPRYDYGLAAQRLADGVYALIGRDEDFTPRNGGNIVNTGFIVGSEGVVVIDTGPSRRYGEQLRAAIARITPLPVVLVINTHAHPDHFLGNQAFPAATLAALPATRAAIVASGEALADNLYRLTGDWMRGTNAVAPGRTLQPGPLQAGGRALELLAFEGHSAADLAVLDRASGVLFAGDLLFHERAPTTPDADFARWLAALSQLQARSGVRLVVPGHGPVSATAERPLVQTRAWLNGLRQHLNDAAERGLDINDVLDTPLPPALAALPEAGNEYRRAVLRHFADAERAALAARVPAHDGTRPAIPTPPVSE